MAISNSAFKGNHYSFCTTILVEFIGNKDSFIYSTISAARAATAVNERNLSHHTFFEEDIYHLLRSLISLIQDKV
jgi:hypothetical protein